MCSTLSQEAGSYYCHIGCADDDVDVDDDDDDNDDDWSCSVTVCGYCLYAYEDT